MSRRKGNDTRNTGMVKCWNDGIMEWWNIGKMKCDNGLETPFRIAKTHYSITPLFHHCFVLIAGHHEVRL
jgi:hypothetical protein